MAAGYRDRSTFPEGAARFSRMSDHDDQPRLGGMALANGLLVHGPTHWATAIRTDDGAITVASGEKPRFARGALADIPVVRGVLRMAEAMAVVPAARANTPGARLAMENTRVLASMAGATMVAAVTRRGTRSVMVQELVAAMAGLVPAVVALRGSQAAIWHGVEHKSIAAYEEGGARGVVHAAAHPKEHDRCGSNLVLPLIATSILANSGLRRLTDSPTTLQRLTASALSLGSALELFAFAGRRPEHPVSRLVHGVGHSIQASFATREPGPDDLAVGRAAMDEILRLEGVVA